MAAQLEVKKTTELLHAHPQWLKHMALNEQLRQKSLALAGIERALLTSAAAAVVAAAEEEQEEEEQGGGDSHKRCALKSKLLGLTDERRALEGAVAANMER